MATAKKRRNKRKGRGKSKKARRKLLNWKRLQISQVPKNLQPSQQILKVSKKI